MRRLLVALIASVGFSVAASAADLPARITKAPVYAPVFNWTGFYIGLNAGYGWASLSDDIGSADGFDGFIGGAQIGYNWQGLGSPWVFGIEADFQGSAQSRDTSGIVLGIPFSAEFELPWFATLRGRLGYAAWDRGLIYVTGGAALTKLEVSLSALGTTVSSDDTKAAWTVGAGIEQMFYDRWSAKLEYLYIDTGDTSVTLFGVTAEGRAKNNIVRLGINYHF
jgi:outer membrane immunogenic protein